MSQESEKPSFSAKLPLVFVALISLILSPWESLAAEAKAKTHEAFLDAPLHHFVVRRGADEFWKLCAAINHPCGEEEAKLNELLTNDDLHLATTTPREVLDAIVNKHPNYQWVLRGGVINLEPKTHAGEDVLSRTLPSLSFHGDSSLKAILDIFHQANIQFSYQPLSRQGRYTRINLSMKNISVRDALNTIARDNKKMIWRFSHSERPDWDGNLIIFSWKKTGVTFSKEERTKVREWIGHRRPKK